MKRTTSDTDSTGSSSEPELPYNNKNRLLTEDDLNILLSENGIDAKFHDLNLYRNAFVHRSYCTRKNENFIDGNANCPTDCLGLQECSNERLEFVGDAVLGLVIGQYVYERFPDSDEGFLTKMRTRLVNGVMLAHLSEKIGLHRYVIISKQIEDNHGRTNAKILEDAFEALLGAIFLDFGTEGYEKAGEFVIHIVENNIDFSELITSNYNYKDMLLKYFQHTQNCMPKFYEVSVENRGNNKTYTMCIKNKEGMVVATGVGTNKKQAENAAAKNCLSYYGQL